MGGMKVAGYVEGLRARHFGQGDARALAALIDAWARCVPQPLCQHARPAHFKNGWVLVDADSPVWLAHLRHQTPTFVRALKREPGLGALEGLRARVRPVSLTGPAQPAPRRFALSPRALAALDALAHDINDPMLKDALFKLVQRRAK
ncbi:MAG: DUF721 domain-containing protein [Acidiferrobacteraceae bacterium]